jgi:undecaprenyl pyrophosphate phosphatase UppP
MLDVIALVGAGVVPLVIGHGGVDAVKSFGVGVTILMLAVAMVVSFLAIHAVLSLARRLKTWVVTLVIGLIAIVFPLLALLTR